MYLVALVLTYLAHAVHGQQTQVQNPSTTLDTAPSFSVTAHARFEGKLHQVKVIMLFLLALKHVSAYKPSLASTGYPVGMNRWGFSGQTRLPGMSVAEELQLEATPSQEEDTKDGKMRRHIRTLGDSADVVAESGSLLALFKPKGMSANNAAENVNSVKQYLARSRVGEEWYVLSRFQLSRALRGIVLSTQVSEAKALEEATRAAAVDLWFDVITCADVAGPSLELNVLPLNDIGEMAQLQKVGEEGDMVHFSVMVAVSEGSSVTTSQVAHSLIDAFAAVGQPVMGGIHGCRRVKKKYTALSLVRVRCAALETPSAVSDGRHHLLVQGRRMYVSGDADRQAQLPALIALLTGPKASCHSEYAPELQKLDIRRLGATPGNVRSTLDALQLFAPDEVWVQHAAAQLEMQLQMRWRNQPVLRKLLQYGGCKAELICCCIRVRRAGHAHTEWIEQGELLADSDTSLGNILRATTLGHDRGNHCEVRALNKAHALCTEHSSTGDGCAVDLMVTHYPCVSCTAVMRQFAALLPNAVLRIGFRNWDFMQRALNDALRVQGS